MWTAMKNSLKWALADFLRPEEMRPSTTLWQRHHFLGLRPQNGPEGWPLDPSTLHIKLYLCCYSWLQRWTYLWWYDNYIRRKKCKWKLIHASICPVSLWLWVCLLVTRYKDELLGTHTHTFKIVSTRVQVHSYESVYKHVKMRVVTESHCIMAWL